MLRDGLGWCLRQVGGCFGNGETKEGMERKSKKRERKRDKERKSLGCMLREELKGKSCSYFPIRIMTFLCSSDPKTSGQAPTAASEGNAALRAFVLFCVWGFDCF